MEDTLVQAVAAIAVSSFEDNYSNLSSGLQDNYGSTDLCSLDPVPDGLDCDGPPIYPLRKASARRSNRSPMFREVKYMPLPAPHSSCYSIASVRGVVGMDVAGGILAAAGTMGLATGPGALVGGLAGSAGELGRQYVDYIWCRLF